MKSEGISKIHKGEKNEMTALTVVHEQVVLEKEFKMYGTKEAPLFLAKDVAKWIEHSNVSMMLNKVDEDEKVLNNVYTLGGAQESWFLTEDGLYEVLMQSRKPIAKAFKKEVKKILKQIRTTGGYIPVAQEDDEATIMAKALMIAQQTLNKKDIIIQQQNAKIETQMKEIEHQKQVIMGLTQDSPKPELRQRINQIIRFGARGGYQGRYALAYKEFDLTHHMNIDVRLRRAIERGEVRSNTNRMDYICTHLDMTWQLYQVVARVFEGDLRAISASIIENTERA